MKLLYSFKSGAMASLGKIGTYFSGIYQMKQLKTLRLLFSKNGWIWTSCFIANGVVRFLFRTNILALTSYMNKLEMRHNLPGVSDAEVNYTIWQNWDWGKNGEEWTPSKQWKQALIDEVLLKYIEREKTVLEIGPGSGRWTETLQKISKQLICVDLADKCIELCKKRFSQCDNIEFFVNDGSNLDFVSSNTVDFIWSFDAFVHIAPQDIEKYLIGFNRVLKKGGRAVIEHAKDAGVHGWHRSRMTAELFCEMLKIHGFTLMAQFDSWGDKGQFDVRRYHDIITVFEK